MKKSSSLSIAAPPPPPLWTHQEETVALLEREDRVHDWSDAGTGKTRAHAHGYTQARNARKCLVLAPKTILETAWQADLREFFPEIVTSVAYASNREAAFRRHADIYITNYDAVTWLVKQ